MVSKNCLFPTRRAMAAPALTTNGKSWGVYRAAPITNRCHFPIRSNCARVVSGMVPAQAMMALKRCGAWLWSQMARRLSSPSDRIGARGTFR